MGDCNLHRFLSRCRLQAGEIKFPAREINDKTGKIVMEEYERYKQIQMLKIRQTMEKMMIRLH